MLLFALFVHIYIYVIVAANGEQCRNYSAINIWPSLFRAGNWYDQVHIYANNAQASETASLFMTRFSTNCGFYELKVKSVDTIELYKGYYVERFDEHFYPFMTRISRYGQQLWSSMYLERQFCSDYGNITKIANRVSILMTDYSSFMVLHQCIETINHIMLLTQARRQYDNDNRVDFERLIEEIMTQFEIQIDNGTFVWPTRSFCQHHIETIYPQFYRKKYIDRNRGECPQNMTIEMIELEDYWQHKVQMDELRKQLLKSVLKAFFWFGVFAGLVTFVMWALDSNFTLY